MLVIFSPLSAYDFCKLSAKTLNDVITEMILVWSVAPALTVNNWKSRRKVRWKNLPILITFFGLEEAIDNWFSLEWNVCVDLMDEMD